MSDMIIYDPQLAVEQAKNTRLIVSQMYRDKDILVKDIDYGVIPGSQKPSLYKPGAEKLCTAFALCPDFEPISQVEDFVNGVFHYRTRCVLYHIPTGLKVATGIGSCNSKEDKYRWRAEECPNCHKQKIMRSRYPDHVTGELGWYCNACKSNFPLSVFTGAKEENTDPYSLVNTIEKMASKRALVAAVLIATNASEFFTQDVEDLPGFDVIEGEYTEKKEGAPKSHIDDKRETRLDVKPDEKPAQAKGTVQRPFQNVEALVGWLRNEAKIVKASDKIIESGKASNIAQTMSKHLTENARHYLLWLTWEVESSKELTEQEFLTLKAWCASPVAQLKHEAKLIEAAYGAAVESDLAENG